MRTRLIYTLLFTLAFAASAKKFREYDQMFTIDDDSALLVSPPEGYDLPGEETSYWLTLAQIKQIVRDEMVANNQSISATYWQFNNYIRGRYYTGKDDSSSIVVSGGIVQNYGANISLYGHDHTQGPDIAFRYDTIEYGRFQDSTGNLDLLSGLSTDARATFESPNVDPLVLNSTTADQDSVVSVKSANVAKSLFGYDFSNLGTFVQDVTTGHYLYLNSSGLLYYDGTTSQEVYHEGNPPTAAETAAWPAFEQTIEAYSNTTGTANRLYINTIYPPDTISLTLPSPTGNAGAVIGFTTKYNQYNAGEDYPGWVLIGHINGRPNNTDFCVPYHPTAGLLWCDGTTWVLLGVNGRKGL